MSTSSDELRREDIVGKRIVGVFQSPWSWFDDIRACEVYVLLDTGVLFELGSPEDEKILPSRVSPASLRPAEFGNAPKPCSGEVVQEVLISDNWPSNGLLLSSNRFLYSSDRYSPKSVEACLSPVGEPYGWEDVKAFCGPHREPPEAKRERVE